MGTATMWKGASTERRHFQVCVLYDPRAMLRLLPIIDVLASCIGNMVNVNDATPTTKRQQSINRASTILPGASCII